MGISYWCDRCKKEESKENLELLNIEYRELDQRKWFVLNVCRNCKNKFIDMVNEFISNKNKPEKNAPWLYEVKWGGEADNLLPIDIEETLCQPHLDKLNKIFENAQPTKYGIKKVTYIKTNKLEKQNYYKSNSNLHCAWCYDIVTVID